MSASLVLSKDVGGRRRGAMYLLAYPLAVLGKHTVSSVLQLSYNWNCALRVYCDHP